MNARRSPTSRAAFLGVTLALVVGCSGPALRSSAIVGDAGCLPPQQAANACVATADALEKAGHWREALLELDRAISFDASLSAKYARRLATLSDRAGDAARAQLEFARALETNPRDPGLIADFGYFHLQHGNHSEAEKRLRQAVTLDASNAAARGNLAACLAKQGRLDEAFAAYAQILPEADACQNIAVVLTQEGRLAEAQAYRTAAAERRARGRSPETGAPAAPTLLPVEYRR